MSRRKIVATVGALAVAALVLATPAEARGPRAGGKSSPAWSSVWRSIAAVWQEALERVGLGQPTPSGDQGGGIDPWG